MKLVALETIVLGPPLDPVKVSRGAAFECETETARELVANGKAVAAGAADRAALPAASDNPADVTETPPAGLQAPEPKTPAKGAKGKGAKAKNAKAK
jgi:hypothetical protein